MLAERRELVNSFVFVKCPGSRHVKRRVVKILSLLNELAVAPHKLTF